MAGALDASFADIITHARARLTQLSVEEDIEPDRAILTIDGQLGQFRVLIKEVISRERRRYAYYVLQADRVLLGFDNHADNAALRLKYGEDFTTHIHELIPHRHGPDKTETFLTEPWEAIRFLQELDSITESVNPFD